MNKYMRLGIVLGCLFSIVAICNKVLKEDNVVDKKDVDEFIPDYFSSIREYEAYVLCSKILGSSKKAREYEYSKYGSRIDYRDMLTDIVKESGLFD